MFKKFMGTLKIFNDRLKEVDLKFSEIYSKGGVIYHCMVGSYQNLPNTLEAPLMVVMMGITQRYSCQRTRYRNSRTDKY